MADSTAKSRAVQIGDRLALGVVLVAVAILFWWAAVDASYSVSLFQTRVFLHLPMPDFDTGLAESMGLLKRMRTVSGDGRGIRILGMSAVLVAGTAASLWVFLRAIHRRDGWSGLALGLVLATWGFYLAAHRRVDEWKVERQARALLPRIEAIGKELHARWPKAPTILKSGPSYFVAPELRPNVLLKRGPHDPYPVGEDLGRLVHRTQAGSIQFDLAASAGSMVEFHPYGTLPTTYDGLCGGSTPARSWIDLKDNWYLVRY